jgi:hypothetical protein
VIVGKFIYGTNGYELELDDRALAHLKVAMFSKLRRNESFSFSWQVDVDGGSGRHSIWISPSSMIHFQFFGSRRPALNRRWIKEMITAANNGDLMLMNEPTDDDTPSDASQGRW